MVDEAGRALGSRYRLHRPIGRGASGEVWTATGAGIDVCLAAKVLWPELAGDPDVRQRFEQEATRQALLVHPGIVRVRDVVREGTVLALVMDLVDGPNLREYLAERRTLPPGVACRLLAEVSWAVAAAHEALIVHRDLKPENVLLESVGDTPPTARVADFGVSRALAGAGVTRGSQLPGTPAYMAPELLAGQPLTAAADVYALGLMLSECLLGRRPTTEERRLLGGRRPNLVGPFQALPPGVVDILLPALSTDPRRRPSAADLATRLHQQELVLASAAALPPAPAPDVLDVLSRTTGSRTRPGTVRRRMAGTVTATLRLPWPRSRVGAAAGLVFLLLVGAVVGPRLSAGRVIASASAQQQATTGQPVPASSGAPSPHADDQLVPPGGAAPAVTPTPDAPGTGQPSGQAAPRAKPGASTPPPGTARTSPPPTVPPIRVPGVLPSASNPAQPSDPPRTPSAVSFANPSDGQAVASPAQISGQAQIPAGQHLWVLIRPPDGAYYTTTKAPSASAGTGSWTANVVIGRGSRDAGLAYQLVAVVVPIGGIVDQAVASLPAGQFSAKLSTVPADAVASDQVRISLA